MSLRPHGRDRAARLARFHLGNGARLERINWVGDTTIRGIAEAFGTMVNHLHHHDSTEASHEVFARDVTIVRSPEVNALPQTD